MTANRTLGWVSACALLVLLSAAFRVQLTLGDENFSTSAPERVLKSDPALLYYITTRIVEGGGLPPADFRADPRIEFPRLTDIPASFTVMQEYLVAWLYLAWPFALPLHVFALCVMSLAAACSIAGVAALARRITGEVRLGLFAGTVTLLLMGNYRTIGAILIREDLALPLYAAHLCALAALLSRADARRGAVYGLTLGLVLASWHLAHFVATIELGLLLLWSVVQPAAERRALTARLSALAGFALMVALFPVLRRTAGATSPPALLLAGLLVWQGLLARARRPIAPLARLGFLALVAGACALSVGLAGSAYSHVHAILLDKLRFLSSATAPADPTAIGFESRLLWQGPFEGSTVVRIVGALFLGGALAPVLVVPVLRAWTTRRNAQIAVLGALFLLSILLGWLVHRLLVLAALLAPVALAVVVQRLGFARRPVLLGLLAAHALFFASSFSGYFVPWYIRPHQQALGPTVAWLNTNVPDSEPVCTDFVNGTTVLAFCGNPILIQPKYEQAASRRRVEIFLQHLFHRSSEDLAGYMAERGTRFLLLDAPLLQQHFAYVAGLDPALPPPPRSAFAQLLRLAEGRQDGAAAQRFRLAYSATMSGANWPMYVFELRD